MTKIQERSKVLTVAVKKRTRRRDFANGDVRLTFDAVATYTLDCGHDEKRAIVHEHAASKAGARLKCKTCARGARS